VLLGAFRIDLPAEDGSYAVHEGVKHKK
jgi:hypothetical protein